MKKMAATLSMMCLMTPLYAAELSVSLAEIPGLAAPDGNGGAEGTLPHLLRIVDEHYDGGDFSYQVFPFGRSIQNVATRKSDVHAPLIDTGAGSPPEFQYIDEPLLDVTFVVYSRKDSPLNADSDFTALRVETMIGHAHFFDFAVDEVASIELGLKKLAKGRTDAFIMEQDAVDGVIKAEGMIDLHRAKYAVWDSTLIVPTGAEGDALNAALSAAVVAAKSDARYAAAAEQVHAPFQDWQP